MKKILALVFLAGILQTSQAQFTRYLVKLKDKNGTPFTLSNPIQYLSQRAIDRRTRYSIAIDSTDLPANSSYVNQIKNVANVTVLNVSNWLNTVAIKTSDPNAISTISGFSFVQSVSGIAARIGDPTTVNPGREKLPVTTSPADIPTSRTQQVEADYYNYGAGSFNEIHLHLGEFLHNIGLRGQGMQIAMLDAGFNNYTSLNAFDSLNAENRVLGTWDFIQNNTDVFDNVHGMECLSTIAANIPGQFVGKAPKASFYLYRTEFDPGEEYPIEEFNWACGAQKGDSAGVDVISTSLGYTTFDNPSLNHVYADMNGNTTIAAISADLAAKKGILVFAAVGNDGSGSWHFLSTPSDGDSVIAVGAVSSSGAVGNFSSYGPSSDGQVKPDVASIGVSAVVETPGNTIGTNNGTSFACPNMAGLGTCLWQGFPEFNNMKIRAALWKAGSKFTTPDDRVGYGIPNMKTAFGSLLTDFATSSSTLNGCRVTIAWTSKDVQAMKYEIERKAPAASSYTQIGQLNPLTGLVLANHNYQFNDDLASGSSGGYSYRIRQIIDTAAATFTAVYIDTTNITLGSPCFVTGVNPVDPTKVSVSIVPNPANQQFTLKLTTLSPIKDLGVSIVDMKGRLVAKWQRSKPAGSASFDFTIDKLSRGKYIVVVYDGEKRLASKELIKL